MRPIDRLRTPWRRAAMLIAIPLMAATAWAEQLHPDDAVVHQHAGEAFQRLDKQTRAADATDVHRSPHDIAPAAPIHQEADMEPRHAQAGLLVGHGQGDLSKGKLVCQRVSELAARADLAKQIRVQIKEHATDRIRERTGREPEQDIEVVREEVVQEFLQGVKIVDRTVDETQHICSATAVMPAHPSMATPAGPPTPSVNAHR